MIRRLAARTIALAALVAAPLAAQSPPQTRPIDPANVDTTCAACRDFFTFANGGWLKRASIPGDQPSWGSFDELYERNLDDLHAILEAAARDRRSSDLNTRRLGNFYGSCMDTTAIERAGTAPVRPYLARAAAVRSRAALLDEIASLQASGLPVAFRFTADQDDKRSDRVIAIASQGGLGLPDRDYYLRGDSASAALRDKYVAHVTRMLRLAGDDSASAARAAASVMELETALARASMTRTEQRNPDSVYHLMPVSELQRTTPAIRWDGYLAARGVTGVREINVRQPAFFRALDSLVANAPLEQWRAYLRWQVLHRSAPLLPARFDREHFGFYSATLQGVDRQRARWKRCVEATDDAIGEILGQAYVRKHFPPEAKARALEMVKNIRAEMRSRLEQLAWMSDATKQKAYAKLDAIVQKIGYPDRWRDYSTLEVVPGDYLGNSRRAAAFEVRRTLGKLGKPVDRSEWGMTPPTVNAYYNASMNEIVFPAGILQPPFFDPNADDAVNYGGMGAVIGHEISHGFDDEGRKYDAQGNLSGWWNDADASEFERRADVVVKQYDGYTAIDTVKVNGKLTLGENIADFAGLTIAYGAYQRSLAAKGAPAPIDGFTGDQRFFLGWAQIWRELRRPEYARLLATVDPHSPGQYRVNGPLANMPEFRKAWGCKPGDPMVRDSTVRAQIW